MQQESGLTTFQPFHVKIIYVARTLGAVANGKGAEKGRRKGEGKIVVNVGIQVKAAVKLMLLEHSKETGVQIRPMRILAGLRLPESGYRKIATTGIPS